MVTNGPPQAAILVIACARSEYLPTLLSSISIQPYVSILVPERSRLTRNPPYSVNGTETLLSLAMITKAGVNTNKVVVGVSSYGRSFRMAEKGCTGPNCKFTGSRIQSDAAKGDCTDTAGMSLISDLAVVHVQVLHPTYAYWLFLAVQVTSPTPRSRTSSQGAAISRRGARTRPTTLFIMIMSGLPI